MDRYIYIIFIAISLFGCNDKKKSNEQKIFHNKTEIKNDFIGKCGPIVLLNNNIIGIDFMSDSCFYKLDITNNIMHRFGNKGQGKNDFIYPTLLQKLNDSTIGTYDIMTKKFTEIKLTNNHSLEIEKEYKNNVFSFYVAKNSNNNTLINLGPYDKNMFILTNETGCEIGSFYEYPYKDKHERNIKNKLRAMAYQGHISFNKSKNKFIYTSSVGDIIHLYKIEDNKISIIKKIENSYPEYITEEKNGGYGAPLKSNNIISHICSYTTNKYIYTLYSGEKIKDLISQGSTFSGDNLLIYNWEGDFVKKIKLDIKCSFFSISNDEKIMWATAELPEPCIVYFNLEPTEK